MDIADLSHELADQPDLPNSFGRVDELGGNAKSMRKANDEPEAAISRQQRAKSSIGVLSLRLQLNKKALRYFAGLSC